MFLVERSGISPLRLKIPALGRLYQKHATIPDQATYLDNR